MDRSKGKNQSKRNQKRSSDGFYDICDHSDAGDKRVRAPQTEQQKKFKKFIRHISRAS